MEKTMFLLWVIILKQFLSNDEFVNFCEEVDERIRNLDYNLKAIKVSKVLRHMGFPKNWKEISTVRKKVDNEGVDFSLLSVC